WQMDIKVVLVDVNPRMVRAWRDAFEDEREVTVVHGSMLAQRVDAWVSPTNALGHMSGGLGAAICHHLRAAAPTPLRPEGAGPCGGWMPVGTATCVPSGRATPRWLVSTPTMVGASDDVSETLNVALACGAAFQAVHFQNARSNGSVRSVALSGLGAGTG